MTQADALTILKTGANVFLTGQPGSGKSHTVRAYVEYLHSHGVDPVITASTGIAATHIHGQTIHSWSGIGIKRSLSPYDIDHIASTEYLSRRIRKATVLIIDEISMIDAGTLEMVDTICREVRNSVEPFGGIQVVLVGDFFQLPPVAKGQENARFAFQSPLWQQMKLLVCYLSEQHRQEDEAFLSVLSAIRDGSIAEHHRAHLSDRIVSEGHLFHDADITRLFPHNADVDTINTHALNSLDGVSARYDMTDKGKEALVAGLKKGCLSPETLILKTGAIVMCTKNNMQKGYVNGTIGIVEGFESGTKFPIIRVRNGDRITIEPVDWSIEEDGKVKASITQLPLRLAWAITVHKSQGMSLDEAVMDLREVFEYGQGYVALSRVRTLSGLHLLGFNEKAFMVHPTIRSADAVFLEQSASAETAFASMDADTVRSMHDKFILAAGGTVQKQKSVTHHTKVHTTDTTRALVLEGKSVTQIAKTRAMVPTTILSHIETLVREGRLTHDEIAHLIPAKLSKALPAIHKAFDKVGIDKLTPAHEALKGKYSFDDLRLARIAILAK